MSHSSQSVQTKMLQLEKQVNELNEQLRLESDGHTKHKKMSSDYQKVCLFTCYVLLPILETSCLCLK